MVFGNAMKACRLSPASFKKSLSNLGDAGGLDLKLKIKRMIRLGRDACRTVKNFVSEFKSYGSGRGGGGAESETSPTIFATIFITAISS
jgi:hypothetical protein